MKFTFDREPPARRPPRFDPLALMLTCIFVAMAAVTFGIVVDILRGL